MTFDINWVPGMTLESIEKATILKAFKFYRGNKTQTAHVLGIAIRTLDNKLEKYRNEEKVEQEKLEADRAERLRIQAHLRGAPSAQPIAPKDVFDSIREPKKK